MNAHKSKSRGISSSNNSNSDSSGFSSEAGNSDSNSSESSSSEAEGSYQVTSEQLLTANQESSDIDNADSTRRKTLDSVPQAKSKAATESVKSVSNDVENDISIWKWLLLIVLILAGAGIFKRFFSKKEKQEETIPRQ